jgi:hypothetical protein
MKSPMANPPKKKRRKTELQCTLRSECPFVWNNPGKKMKKVADGD